jgi:hypothetical protein
MRGLPASEAGNDGGTLLASAFPVWDNSMMAPVAEPDCLVIRKPYAAAARAGSNAWWLNWTVKAECGAAEDLFTPN